MKNEEIIEMAREAGYDDIEQSGIYKFEDFDVEAFAKLVEEKVTARYMQLFLDPENQPTQFGTATQEYRAQELQEVQGLLKELAHIVRTKHLYGPEMKKLLEKEDEIRARGQA